MPSCNSQCLSTVQALPHNSLANPHNTPRGQLVSDVRHPEEREITLCPPNFHYTETMCNNMDNYYVPPYIFPGAGYVLYMHL